MAENNVTIRWGDGYLCVEPCFPKALLKKLQYWHRALEWDEGLMRRVASGEYRQLYKVQGYIGQDNQYVSQLVTMPGFMHRIKTVLDEEGYTYTIVDERTPMPVPDYIAAFEGLREYQKECTYTALMSGGGIIACPTGFGKTHIIASIAKAYSHADMCARNTPLIVVATPEKDITRKDYLDLKKLLPDREIGIVMSGRKLYSDDIQVITLNSLHKLDPEEIGIVIVDEVHTAASDKRTETLLEARRALMWGVSATPTGRFDGRDIVTEGLFGPSVYEHSYQQGVIDGALVPIRVLWVTSPEPSIGIEKYRNYKSRAGMYRHGLERNQARNELIGKIISRTPDKQQLLCIMQHLDQMDKLLPYCPGTRVVHAEERQDGLTKKRFHNLAPVPRKERTVIYDAMASGEIRKILSTYVYKQGVNFPELSVVINAGGGGSDIVARQIPGRESRNIEGKEEAYLVDFWHPWDFTIDKETGQHKLGPVHKDDRSRERAYTDLGFDQVWLDDVEQLPFLQAKAGCSNG